MLDVQGIGSITFNSAAIIISVTCVFYMLIMTNKLRMRSKLFIGLCSIVALDALTGVANALIRAASFPDFWKILLLNISLFVYFSTHFAVAPIFALYIVFVCNVQFRFSGKRRWMLSVPFVFMEILCFLNPLFHTVYSVDKYFQSQRQAGVYIAYAISGFYVVFAAVALIIYWGSLSKVKKVAILYFTGLVFAGTLVQMLFREIRSELMSEAIGFMGLMMMLENDDDRIDVSTRINNRNAFIKDVGTYFKYKMDFYTICIRIVNADIYRKIAGYEEFEKVLAKVAEYLNTLGKNVEPYRVGTDNFIITVNTDNKIEADSIAEKLFERFSKEWLLKENSILLKAMILEADSPKQFASVDYLLLLCDSTIEEDTDRILKEHDLDFILRQADVERAVKRGIENDSFKIYFIPIYTHSDLMICAAEAHLLLKDSLLGTVEQSEFIPIAEQTGTIERIGWLMIEQVFYFLGGGIVEEMGLEFISINLSSAQIIKSDFVEKVRSLWEKYGVSPSKVVFEISESAASADQNILNAVMHRLSEDGVRFFMDEYGTGFFNMQSTASFIFEGVKIDAQLLASTARIPQSRIILENRLRMIGQMGKKIVLSDVDDQERLEIATSIKCDYLQGEYFSLPVSKNEFIAILKATEMARMEERRAKAANEAKSNFLANMSHEIRTPINAVLGLNEVILRECKEEKILEYAKNIEGAGRTLLSLINDILDFSKIEAGSMEISEAEYDFSSVLNDVYNMVSIKAEQKMLKLIFNVDENLADTMYGDEMRLRQIMVNILNNAIKYTQEGSVTLTATGERQFDGTVMLRIDIADTGMGIKEDDLKDLFEKFKRLDIEKNKTVEGSGLGLAITSSLLELMHGSISVESEYGKGSVFSIFLPQKVVGETKIGDFRKRISSNLKDGKKYKEKFTAPDANILVVDDTPMNHVVITELLKPIKLTIESARSGAECLEKQALKKYDIIFLDYRMPGMDGVETFNALKADENSPNKTTPIIVLTANAISGARDSFMKMGFDDYLTKPIDSNRLEECLTRFLPDDKIIFTIPDEAQNVVDISEPKEEAKENESENKAEWLDKLTGINTELGISNCGSAESYLNILKVYYESIETSMDNIRRTYEEENWKDYTSFVHSLKSTSRTIGADKLSALAEQMEMAGNDNDLDAIRDKTEGLLSLYASVKEALDGVPEITGKNEDESDKQDISKAQLADAYSSILEVSKILDFDTLSFILDSLKEYRLPPDDADAVKKISDYAYKLKWDEIVELVKSRVEAQE